MRTFLLSLVAATAIVSTATLTAPSANAVTLGSAAAIRALIQDTNTIEDVAIVCRHRAFSSREVCRRVLTCVHRPFSSRQRCY